jgi:thermostable 8-oxoguanine DNA glycosylase
MVDLNRLDEAMNRAKQTAIRESSAIVSLHRAIQSNGKVVIESMERQDYNKDGLLNIDGFEASLLIREVGMSNSDLKEVFYLICGSDQLLPYQTWILTKFP